MSSKFSRLVRTSVVALIVLESLTLAYLMRPMQDDYFNLDSVQEMGVVGYLSDTWNWHGGNMVQYLIHYIVISPTTQGFAYWNLGLFFLATQLLVFFTVRTTVDWLFPSNSSSVRFWVPLLSVAGFEGIFVPGFLGAYGFSLATLAHLWPVMAFVVGLIGLKQFPGSWTVAFLLGLVAGNSNLGESAFACGAWILAYLGFFKIPNFAERSGIEKNSNFYSLGVGTLLGTIGIAAAPGFWNRASDQVGLPESFMDFIFRFAKSFASFTADALSHPMIWVLFLLGALVVSRNPIRQEVLNSFRLKVIAVGSFLIWAALVLGSTFAYPAWHQSMGMYVLLLPFAFSLGIANSYKVTSRILKSALAIAVIVTTAVLLRAGITGVNRSLEWDRNLQKNVCLLQNDPDAKLLGAEIQYPPFNLGVEDVNTWDWMRDKYAGWVTDIPNNTKCD